MIYNLFSLEENDQWEAYLSKLTQTQKDIYYYPEYYRLYKEIGDGEPYCFVFQQNENLALYPFLKNKIENKDGELTDIYYDIQGAYGYNGVLSNNYEENFKESFSVAFGEFCIKNNIIAEFTRFHPLLKNHSFFDKHLQLIKDRQTVWLDLEKEYDSIWTECYSSKNRNMIRKARNSGVEVSVASNEEDYRSFYQIYLNTMKEVGASPYYFFNEQYALNFNAYLKTKQNLLIAKYHGKVICVMLLMINEVYAHYHLSGRLKEYSKLAANNLLLDIAIQQSKELGAQFFHFGGGNSNDLSDPLFKFKSNFSKTWADFYIGKKVHNKKVYEQICSSWEKNYPELKEKYKHFLLKYRQTS